MSEEKLKLIIDDFLFALNSQINKDHIAPLNDKLSRELYAATCKAALEVCKKAFIECLRLHGVKP